MTVFQFILASLCCFRLTVLIVRDVGPWRMFARLRSVAHFTKLLTCVFCTSLWVAAGIETAFLLSRVHDKPVVIVCIVFAMSGITVILDRTWTVDHNPK